MTSSGLDSPDNGFFRPTKDAGHGPTPKLCSVLLGGLHDCLREKGGVNNRDGVRRAKTGRYCDAVREPTELRETTPAHFGLGKHKTGICAHAPIAPVALDLAGKLSVKRKAAPCQGIERQAGAPIVG